MQNVNLITKDFCNRPTIEVAQDLLGCILHRKIDNGVVLSGMIVETEAYTQNDPACHAFKGKTPRSAQMFGQSGLAYIYLIYGMYHCFNVVTEPEDIAGAVLIRALEPISPLVHTHGPGRLCKSMNINKELNGNDLTSVNSRLFITGGKKISRSKVQQTTRIGISVAKDYKWRFYIKENPHVSVR